MNTWICCVLLALSATQESYKALFSPAQWQSVSTYLLQSKNIRQQSQLHELYRMARAGETDFAAPLQKQWDRYLTQLNVTTQTFEPVYEPYRHALDGLELRLLAEGTQFVFRPRLSLFVQWAKQTPESADDRFFTLMQDMHGEVWTDFRQWMIQTWDYGGCSKLGRGLHLKFLKAIQQERQLGTPFAAELQKEQDRLEQDLLHAEGLCGPQTPAIKELMQILTEMSWSSEKKGQLQKRLTHINNGGVPINQALEMD